MRLIRPTTLFLALAGLGSFAGCSSSNAQADSAAPAAQTRQEPEYSLYDQRMARVAANYQSLLEYAQRPDDQIDQGNVARRFHEVGREFDSIISDNPDKVEARVLYGKLLDFFGDREGAQTQFAYALRLNPNLAVVNQYMGTFHAEEGNFGEALAYYLRATELAPNEALYFYALGELLYTYRPGLLEAGILQPDQLDQDMFRSYQRAAELAPELLELQFRYGEAFYDLPEPDWEQAFAHWRKLQSRNDLSLIQSDAVRLHTARVLGELHRYQDARDVLQLVVQEGLAANKKALLEAIDDAEAREKQGQE
ncbi:MAG: hypothetical protein Q7P63_11265 [Verrucomicrobiota bacterium JB022]|nr:hypothetical protein [Verrucomicrobiota bacterium JB022]